jgi:hypothetical protein
MVRAGNNAKEILGKKRPPVELLREAGGFTADTLTHVEDNPPEMEDFTSQA